MLKTKKEREIKKIEKAAEKLQKVWQKTTISNEALYGLLNVGIFKTGIDVFALDSNDEHIIQISKMD